MDAQEESEVRIYRWSLSTDRHERCVDMKDAAKTVIVASSREKEKEQGMLLKLQNH